jgi:membrane-associated phospholipid phosphatase
MTGLSCPQIHNQPISVRLSAATGMWWNLPPASERLIERIHSLGQNSFPFDGDDFFSSYPGGHAMRSSFVGVLACWLCWRHIKHLFIRVPLMALVLIVSLSIGLIQFYIGAHLITDTIAGYVFGIAAACCAIGLLLLNGPRPKEALEEPLAQPL